MKKILVIGGSNSSHSINKAFALFAASSIGSTEIQLIDLNDYEMPIFSIDREEESGIPSQALTFLRHVESSDGIIISLAEHNGSYSVAFKNLLDWTSREQQKLWSDKPMFLMSTSPGGRGGATVLAAAEASFPRLGANIASTFSLPSFYYNYSEDSGIVDENLKSDFESALSKFTSSL